MYFSIGLLVILKSSNLLHIGCKVPDRFPVHELPFSVPILAETTVVDEEPPVLQSASPSELYWRRFIFTRPALDVPARKIISLRFFSKGRRMVR